MVNGNYKTKKGRNIIIIILIVIAVSLLVTNIISVYHMDFDIKFESVEEFDKPSTGSTDAFWLALKNPAYNGFFSNDILQHKYSIEFNDFDFKKYTYIVTFGYELNKISYSYDTTKNWKLALFPKVFVGKVVLLDEYKEKIYIYKIPAMDIDCDYHERDREVYFIKDGTNAEFR